MGKIAQSIEKISSLLKNDTTGSVLKEYFELLTEHTGLLEKRLEDLENENRKLRDENITLKSGTVDQTEADTTNFVEARGAYFLRKAEGIFSETPFCPICKAPMSDVFGENE